jgi:hypothetical protein
MPKTVEAVFFDIGLVFAGDFCLYITWLRLIKNLTPLGGKRVRAGIIMFGELQVGMAAGRVVFGSDNTRPDIIPDPYTNIHTHQVNRVKNWTRTRTHRVSVGYRVSCGYGTAKYKSACKLMNNTVYDRCELINNITTCEIYKQHHQFTNHRFIVQV